MEAGLPHAAKYAWGHEAPAPTMFFVFMRPRLMRATAGSLLYNSIILQVDAMMAGAGGDKPPDDPEKIAKEMQMAASKGASANKTNGKRACIQTGPIDAKKICVGPNDPMLGQAEHTLNTLNQLYVQNLREEVDAATDGPLTPGSASSSRDPLAAAVAAHAAAKTQWVAGAASPGQSAAAPPDPPAAAQRPPAQSAAVSPGPPPAAQMPPPAWQEGTLSLQEQVNRIEAMQVQMAAILVRAKLNSEGPSATKSPGPHPRIPGIMPRPQLRGTPPAIAPGTLPPPPRMAPPTNPPEYSRPTPNVMNTPTSSWTIPPGGIIAALIPESLPTQATAAPDVPPGAAGTGDAPDAIRALTEAVIKAIAKAKAEAATETTGTTDQSTPPEEHPTQTPPTQAAEDHAATQPAQAAEDQAAETGRCLL